MATFRFSATTRRAPRDVLNFFGDMRNAPTWDPSVRDVVRLDENDAVGIGASFRVTVAFAKRHVTLVYHLTEFDPDHRLVLRATSPLFISEDTVTVTPGSDQVFEVTYQARLSGRGVTRLLNPLLQRAINGFGEPAGAKLRETYFS